MPFALLCVFNLCALCVKNPLNRKGRKNETREERKSVESLSGFELSFMTENCLEGV
jgi:hypothetical protein